MITFKDKTYRVVLCTAAGRKRYLSILFDHVCKQKNIVDEYHLWHNTDDALDSNYIYSLENSYDFVKVIPITIKYNKIDSIYSFFKYCIDNDTIYIRLDDDIVWLEPNFIEKLCKFRLENPEYFLIYGNTINNAIMDHIHQRLGVYNIDHIFGYSCFDQNGWSNPNLAIYKHQVFLDNLSKNNLDIYKFSKWNLFHHERTSINAICWFGEEFAKFNGVVDMEDEHDLSTPKPISAKKINAICGDCLCVHFAFGPQRQIVDNTDLLDRYRNLLL